MRVALVVEQAWHPVPGGTARSILETLAVLRTRSDVEVVPVAARHADPGAVPPPVAHLPLPRVALYRTWERLRRPAVQRVTGHVDVVHATSLAVPPAGDAALVVTVHDLAFRTNPDGLTPRGLRFFERGLRIVRTEADMVLCPSQAAADECAGAGIARDRLRVVPHGVRVPPPVPSERIRAFREWHGLHRDYIFWCGTVEPRKNVPALLAAFDRLVERGTDLDLVLAGPPGWGAVPTELPGAATHRIHRVGFLDQDGLRTAYAGARAFCYPSLAEGFGLPVLEAMAQGVPVVTSRGTATEEAAGGSAMLVDPRDIDGLAAAIAAAAGDRHDELSASGTARAARASWEHAADLTVAAYDEAVSRRQAR